MPTRSSTPALTPEQVVARWSNGARLTLQLAIAHEPWLRDPRRRAPPPAPSAFETVHLPQRQQLWWRWPLSPTEFATAASVIRVDRASQAGLVFNVLRWGRAQGADLLVALVGDPEVQARMRALVRLPALPYGDGSGERPQP